MKNLLIILLLTMYVYASGQFIPCENFCLTFEDTLCLRQLHIDTTYAENIWQIGKPVKFPPNTPISNSRVIITDSLQPYPINNTSVFYLSYRATYGDIYGFKSFSGGYYTQTDSLKDYATIEFSYDKGISWIDLLNDTNYTASIVWFSTKPVFTGNSGNTWRYFDVMLADNGAVFDIHLGDTLYYRFTFHSDSIFDNLNGIMFDELCLHDFVEGISETRFTPIHSKLFPNPVVNIGTIEFENPDAESFELALYDIHSHRMLTEENITGQSINLDLKDFKSGTYVYKITALKTKKRSWGKFVKL